MRKGGKERREGEIELDGGEIRKEGVMREVCNS